MFVCVLLKGLVSRVRVRLSMSFQQFIDKTTTLERSLYIIQWVAGCVFAVWKDGRVAVHGTDLRTTRSKSVRLLLIWLLSTRAEPWLIAHTWVATWNMLSDYYSSFILVSKVISVPTDPPFSSPSHHSLYFHYLNSLYNHTPGLGCNSFVGRNVSSNIVVVVTLKISWSRIACRWKVMVQHWFKRKWKNKDFLRAFVIFLIKLMKMVKTVSLFFITLPFLKTV